MYPYGIPSIEFLISDYDFVKVLKIFVKVAKMKYPYEYATCTDLRVIDGLNLVLLFAFIIVLIIGELEALQ